MLISVRIIKNQAGPALKTRSTAKEVRVTATVNIPGLIFWLFLGLFHKRNVKHEIAWFIREVFQIKTFYVASRIRSSLITSETSNVATETETINYDKGIHARPKHKIPPNSHRELSRCCEISNGKAGFNTNRLVLLDFLCFLKNQPQEITWIIKKLFGNCIYRTQKTGNICNSFIHNCTVTYSNHFIAFFFVCMTIKKYIDEHSLVYNSMVCRKHFFYLLILAFLILGLCTYKIFSFSLQHLQL